MGKKVDPYIKENQPRWDAQTLAEAEKIKSDPSRVKKAADAAKQMSIDAKKEANFMSKVASKNNTKQSGSSNSKQPAKSNQQTNSKKKK